MDEYIKRSDMRAVLEKASISPRFADEPPAADVEPVRHGRWVLVHHYNGHDEFKCSECGRRVAYAPYAYAVEDDYPYCHCGAHMDEEVTQDE